MLPYDRSFVAYSQRRPRPPTMQRSQSHPIEAAASRFVVLDAEPGEHVFGAWKGVFVAIWKVQATGAKVDRLEKAVARMTARNPGMRSNVHVVLGGSELPTPEARAGLAALMKRNKGDIACVATVIGGDGFWASALRSASTGIQLVAGSSIESRMFRTVDAAAAWLAPAHEEKTGVHLDVGELRAVLGAAPTAER